MCVCVCVYPHTNTPTLEDLNEQKLLFFVVSATKKNKYHIFKYDKYIYADFMNLSKVVIISRQQKAEHHA